MQQDRGFEVECLARTQNKYTGDIITTFRLKYPRFIHSELMTHRMFSRNASSSRAIPFTTLMNEESAIPISWGLNRPGMQATEELNTPEAICEWSLARDDAFSHASELFRLGYHKQIVNRLVEPFQFINVLVTATDWDNFFMLRRSDQAQPEIHFLADMMFEEMKNAEVIEANWHLPFKGIYKSLEESLVVNTSKAAKISYNKDRMECFYEKHKELHDMLWEHKHMSPFEHCARGFDEGDTVASKAAYSVLKNNLGIDWIDPFYCRNFRSFKSYRFLLENHEAIY